MKGRPSDPSRLAQSRRPTLTSDPEASIAAFMKKPDPILSLSRRRLMQSLATLTPLALSRPGFAQMDLGPMDVGPMDLETDDPFSMAERNDLIGGVELYQSKEGDTLIDLVRERDLGILEVMAVNPGFGQFRVPTGSTLVFPSMHILPDAPREGLVVNLAELRLYYFRENLPTVTSAIGVGRDGFATPIGSTTVVRKMENPTWYPSAETRKDKPEVASVVQAPAGGSAAVVSACIPNPSNGCLTTFRWGRRSPP